MISVPKITCIIAAWNEAPRIGSVLEVACNSKYFAEIIVVDDGSTDGTSTVVEDFAIKYPHLNLITSLRNQGKAAAITIGIKAAQHEMVVLLDADLKNINDNHIAKLVEPVANNQYAMTILDRGGDRRTWLGFTNVQRLLGGERCLWREDFLSAAIDPKTGFLLEVELNDYYLKHNKSVLTIYIPELDSDNQMVKHGEWLGVYRYGKTTVRIMFRLGIWGLLQQLIDVDEDISLDLKLVTTEGRWAKLQRFLKSWQRAIAVSRELRK